MNIEYLNTFINLVFKNTNDDTGLSNDTWLLVKLSVDNPNFHYEVERKSLTRNEVLTSLEALKNYYYKSILEQTEFTYIKNYVILKLNPIHDHKEIEIKFISLLNKEEKIYTLQLKDKEIEEFINLIEASNI